MDYLVHLPPYGHGSDTPLPRLYLLHGRGDAMTVWLGFFAVFDENVRSGRIAPMMIVAPDAPWSQRASWYVDSRFTSAADPGYPVETALAEDLVAHVDSRFPDPASRHARIVAGYSMGGAGALRLALGHQPMFGAAIVLSPAVYAPLPPRDSNARSSGAYGLGRRRFVAARYRELSYDALLVGVQRRSPVTIFVAAGDDEYQHPQTRDGRHDMPIEVARLHGRLRRTPGISAHLRIYEGGHDPSLWWPAMIDGLRVVGRRN
jgi:enterochelin esterase-like enzyme